MIASLVLLLALQAEETVTYGNVVVRLPEGWKVVGKEEGLFLRPGDLKKEESYVVILPPASKADVNLAAGFEKTWKQVLGTRKLAKKAPEKEVKTDGGVDGLLSVGLMDDADDNRLIATVAVFKAGDRFQPVLALTAEDHVFQRYSEAYGALLKGLRFRNLEPANYDLLMSMGYGKSEGKTSVYVLFRDGGWLDRLPAGGLDGLDAAAAKPIGTHETKDGVLTLRAGARVDTLKAQADGSYRTAENAQFLRIPPSTGLRLDGRFVLHGGNPETQTIVFKADGSFDDRGGGAAFIDPVEARAMKGTTGTFEIVNNTITLHYDKTGSKRVSFLVLPKAGDPSVEFILLNGTWFKRE
ncbi:MAG: hypothetical protein HY293_02015 [Planctomycetes bacterium]|nr:hypothetical protein [Planctomycetota bacterium]